MTQTGRMRSGPVPADFIRRHTRPMQPPLVPEVTLLVADDVVLLWEAMEAEGGVAEEPPFWCAAWPGGQALARYVLDQPQVVAGRDVLDLGSGSGLVAVAARLAGARRVVASEIDPYGVTAIGVNAAENGIGAIDVVGDVLDEPLPGGISVVLAGDVCYAREMTGRVLPFLDTARAAGTEVLIGDPGRAYLPSVGLARMAGYDVPDADGGAPRRASVWRLP
jgi:predicted nicotinamide N-methyase